MDRTDAGNALDGIGISIEKFAQDSTIIKYFPYQEGRKEHLRTRMMLGRKGGRRCWGHSIVRFYGRFGERRMGEAKLSTTMLQ